MNEADKLNAILENLEPLRQLLIRERKRIRLALASEAQEAADAQRPKLVERRKGEKVRADSLGSKAKFRRYDTSETHTVVNTFGYCRDRSDDKEMVWSVDEDFDLRQTPLDELVIPIYTGEDRRLVTEQPKVNRHPGVNEHWYVYRVVGGVREFLNRQGGWTKQWGTGYEITLSSERAATDALWAYYATIAGRLEEQQEGA